MNILFKFWTFQFDIGCVACVRYCSFHVVLFKSPYFTTGTAYSCETTWHCFKKTFLHVFKMLLKSVQVQGNYCRIFNSPLLSAQCVVSIALMSSIANLIELSLVQLFVSRPRSCTMQEKPSDFYKAKYQCEGYVRRKTLLKNRKKPSVSIFCRSDF